MVRRGLQLPRGQGLQRTDRSDQQLDQAHQTSRLWLSELRELSHPGTALRRKTKLASARLDRGAMSLNPLQSDEPVLEVLNSIADAFDAFDQVEDLLGRSVAQAAEMEVDDLVEPLL